jgi:hypothetical protein
MSFNMLETAGKNCYDVWERRFFILIAEKEAAKWGTVFTR